MHALIVFAHPEPQSFNGTLKDVAVRTLRDAGYTVEVSDLYGERFDPVEKPGHYDRRAAPEAFSPLVEQRSAWRQGTVPADVQREIRRLERADLLILHFPIWWHGPPAILKGWFDRVFLSGGLYTSRMRYDRGYFRGRRAVSAVTIGAPPAVLVPGGRGGELDALLWPVQYSLYYMGFSVLPASVASAMPGPGYTDEADAECIQRQLDGYSGEWSRRLARLDGEQPVDFPGWHDWDEQGRPTAERAPERRVALGRLLDGA